MAFMLLLSTLSKATVHIITVQSYEYTPNSLSINCGDTVRFSWINGAHPTRSETGAWSTFILDDVTPTIDIILPGAGSYPYYCEFHGAAGGIGMSGVINVSCVPPSCNTPSGLTANNITTTSARVSWIAVPGATKYQIQFRPVGAPTWSKTSATATFKKLSGLSTGTNYEYKVKTICGALSSPFTATQNFTTLGLTGEIDAKEEPMGNGHNTQMGIYPNPSPGEFKLVLEHVHQEEVLVQIFDMTGQLLLEKNIPVTNMFIVATISMPEGFKGNALVKVNVGGKDFTQNLLIQ